MIRESERQDTPTERGGRRVKTRYEFLKFFGLFQKKNKIRDAKKSPRSSMAAKKNNNFSFFSCVFSVNCSW